MKSSVISRYLLKETGLATLAVALVLVGVLFTNALIRLLGQAAENDLPSSGVLSLLGLATISYFSFLLPASILLGIVLTFGRLYRDSEMPALAACGIGPWQLFRALLWLAVPTALIVGWLSLSVAPWASRTASNVQAMLQQSLEIEGIRAGRFLTSKRAQGMLYVEDISAEGEMREVFLQTEREGEIVIVTARTAKRQTEPETGDNFLILRDGYRMEGVPGELRWRMLRFDEHGVRLSEGAAPDVRIRQRGVPTTELIARGEPADVAELQWRLSAPLMVLVLTLLAVPVSKTAPREGRYGKLMAAVLLFVAYSTLLNAAAEWIKTEQLPPWIGLWWIHGLMVVIGLVWLQRSFGMRWSMRRRQQ